eukprot:m.57443 g.57443  ORF g.57443 m.57443 type:complete len:71 (+) comp12742_c1_seq2:346-558(+)
MARGMAKVQSKEKRAKKDAQQSKQIDGKAARANQLKIVCSVCKAPMSDARVYKVHFEAKHSKFPLPDELK